MKFKAILWKYHPQKNGSCAVKIRVSDKDSIKYFPLDVSVKPTQWDQKSGRVKPGSHPNAAEINMKIIEKLNAFEKNYIKEGSISDKKIHNDFYHYFQAYIDYNHGFFHKRKLTTVMRKLKEFSPTLSVKQVNYEFMRSFEKYMADKKYHPNYISDSLGRIKTVMNEVVKSGAIPYHENPFLNIRLSRKKSFRQRLSFSDIAKVASCDLPDKKLAFWRDVYVFSFYSGGIRFGDACRLKVKHVSNGRLRYLINKTHRGIELELIPEALSIFKRHSKGKKPDDYVFGLLDTSLESGEEAQIAIKNVVCNRSLEDIAKIAGVQKFTFHTARHSLADHAIRSGVDIHTLKGIFGHTKVVTTEIYAQDIYDENKKAAMKKMFGG